MGMFSGILGAIGSVIAGPIGGAIGGALGGAVDGDRARSDANKAADKSNAFNAEEAQKQRVWSSNEATLARGFNAEQAAITRDYQSQNLDKVMAYDTAMSNSAYQRATADMKAAGLNPMLAYSQGGASSPTAQVPSGATASASVPSGAAAHGFDRVTAVQTGLQATRMAQDIQESQARTANINADTTLKGAQTNREVSSANNIDMSTKEIGQRITNMQENLHLIRAQEGTELWKQALMIAQRDLARLQGDIAHQNIGLIEAQTKFERAKTLLANLAAPEARNAANAQDSWWMRNISPYLPDVLKSTGAAGGFRGLLK